MSGREFIAGVGAAARWFGRLQRTGDRLRSLSIEILSLKAGPNEISGLLLRADEWLTVAARLPPPCAPRADGYAGRSVAAHGWTCGA
jgi:hypothetical protein